MLDDQSVCCALSANAVLLCSVLDLRKTVATRLYMVSWVRAKGALGGRTRFNIFHAKKKKSPNKIGHNNK